MCNKKKATHWFGDTSVALCDDQVCVDRNHANWDRMLEEMEEDEKRRDEW
jgi:hypothetical protein